MAPLSGGRGVELARASSSSVSGGRGVVSLLGDEELAAQLPRGHSCVEEEEEEEEEKKDLELLRPTKRKPQPTPSPSGRVPPLVSIFDPSFRRPKLQPAPLQKGIPAPIRPARLHPPPPVAARSPPRRPSDAPVTLAPQRIVSSQVPPKPREEEKIPIAEWTSAQAFAWLSARCEAFEEAVAELEQYRFDGAVFAAAAIENDPTLVEALAHHKFTSFFIKGLILSLKALHRQQQRQQQQQQQREGFLDPDDLEVSEEKLGKGHFGDVYKGHLRGVPVAVKEMRGGAPDELEREAEMLAKVCLHPHIVTFHGLCRKADGKVRGELMVLELVNGGSLDQTVRSHKLPLAEKMDITEQILDALCFMHGQKPSALLHRDIAIRNVLYDRIRRTAKLSDLGMTRATQSADKQVYYGHTGKLLPIAWSAPETLEGLRHTTASDVYMMGITMWELVANGEKPFQEYGPRPFDDLIRRIVHEELRPSRPAGGECNCPERLWTLIQRMWSTNPKKRPTAEEVLGEVRQLRQDAEETSYYAGVKEVAVAAKAE